MKDQLLLHLKSGGTIESIMSGIEYDLKDYENNVNGVRTSMDNDNCDHYIMLEVSVSKEVQYLGRACACIGLIEQLRAELKDYKEALENAQKDICSEYCYSLKHHPFCSRIKTVLNKHREGKDG